MAQTIILPASALAAPAMGATSTATTGGTLAAGTYYYRVSATNANGETVPGAEVSKTTTGTTSTVTVNWTQVPGATGYKIYGRATGAEQFIASVGAVATYIDDGSVSPSGAMPAANTTGGTDIAVSADFTVVAGTPLSVYLFTDSAGGIPPNEGAAVFQVTPAQDLLIAELNGVRHPRIVLEAAGTYRCRRHASSVNIGVCTE